jgi:predicted HD phosphohydrolase
VFTPEEAERFIRQSFAADAVKVRLWDDAAKVAGAATPDLTHFAAILRTVCGRAA